MHHPRHAFLLALMVVLATCLILPVIALDVLSVREDETLEGTDWVSGSLVLGTSNVWLIFME